MTKLENRCANCGGKLGLVGPALLLQSLQEQLPCENGKGPCVHEKGVWLLTSRSRGRTRIGSDTPFSEPISPRSEVCSVNISRPYTDFADWSVHDPQETLDVHCGNGFDDYRSS